MIIKTSKREQIFPLPVALISTMDDKKIYNIAPWSNITPILRPLEEIVIASWIKRDTLNNIRTRKEFVVNIPSCDMIEEVVTCSKNYPPEINEFEEAGLKPRPSSKIKVPGIEGCLAWAECILVEEISRKNYSLIIGKVVHMETDDTYFDEAGDMDFEHAQPLSTMLGEQEMQFTRPVAVGRKVPYSEMFINSDKG